MVEDIFGNLWVIKDNPAKADQVKTVNILQCFLKVIFVWMVIPCLSG
jgi:hypothetical protein